MRFLFLKRCLILVLFILPFTGKAQDNLPETFHYTCVNEWMNRVEGIKDKGRYQNFGDKYCTCVAGLPLNNVDEIVRTARNCISRTLLLDAMEAIDDDLGYTQTTLGDINEYCQDRWALIYPQMTDADKRAGDTYCNCAKSPLLALAKKSDSMGYQAFDSAVEEIAKNCAGNIKQHEKTIGKVH